MSTIESSTPDVPKPRLKKKRRWPWIVGAILLILVLLILLAPTIASMGFVRSMVVGKVNENLNGTLAIDDWSIGWTSGVNVTGINLRDESGEEIFKGQASTQLSLLDAIRGNIALGKTIVTGSFVGEIDENGEFNFAKIAKPSDEPASDEPVTLPDITGDITLKLDGKILQANGPTVFVPAMNLDAVITDINQPISPKALVEVRVGEGETGKINLDATVDAIENNTVNLEKLVADAKLTIAGIDLSAVNPFLAASETKLTGIANGSVDFKTEGLTKPVVKGQIDIANTSIAGQAIQGDTLVLGQVSIPLNVTANVAEDGNARLRIEKVRVQFPQGFVDVAGEIGQQTIDNLLANRAPGEDGWITATIAISDAPGIINQLPKLIPMQQGVKLTGGQLSVQEMITFRPADVVQKARVDFHASGTSDARPISISPITISVDGTYKPRGDILEGLKDLALVMKSDFATIAGGGTSIAKLQLGGNFDLAKLRQQAAQFVDLKDLQLAGTGSFNVDTAGDVSKPNDPLKAGLALNLADINVVLPDLPALKYEKVAITGNAQLTPGGAPARAIRSANLTVQTIDGGAAIIDLAASANGVDLETGSIQRFEVSKLAIADLARAQSQIDPFVPALTDAGIRITEGQLYTNVAGSYDGQTRTLKLEKPLELSTPNLTVQKMNDSGQAVSVLNRERLHVSVLGQVAMPADGSIAANLSTFSITTSSKMLSVAKSQNDLVFKQSANGAISGSGAIEINGDLVPLNQLVQAFTGGETGPLKSGLLSAVVSLARGDSPQTTLKVDGKISGLSIAADDPAGAIENETLSFNVSALSPDDLSGIRDLSAAVEGPWLSAGVKNGQINLGGSALEMVQSAEVEVNSPDLAKLQRVVDAFVGSAEPSANVAAGEKPLPPLVVQKGQLNLAASVKREGDVTCINVPSLTIANLALSRGDAAYAFDSANPISLKLASDIRSAGETIGSIKVTQLNGDLQVARLSMPQAITVSNLSSTPSATGEIALEAALENLTPLLAVLQGGDEMPYAGQLAMKQTLSTSGDAMKLLGGLTITNFQVRDATDRSKVAFSEPEIAVQNDLAVDLKASNATINALNLTMPQSKALGVAIKGAVNDWAIQRQLQSITLDLSYDLPKIWLIVKPMLNPQQQEDLKELKIAGAYTKRLNVRGSYPAQNAKGEALAFNESIKSISADGSITVDLLDAMGLNIQKLEIPLLVDKGQAAILTTDRKRPAPAVCNNGTFDLGEITVDLTADEPRLWMAKNQELLRNVTINPLLGDSLGKYVNPVFTNTERAQGLLDVTVEYCKGVALLSKWQTEESGSARIVFSLVDMDIANPLGSMMLGKLSSVASIGNFSKQQADTFKGRIQDAVVTLDRGRTTQDVTLSLTAVDPATVTPGAAPKTIVMPLSFKGDIRLNDLSQNLQVNIPVGLLAGMGSSNDVQKALRTAFPSGIPLTLKGTTTSPQVDPGNFAKQFLEGQIKGGVGGVLEDLLKKR